MLTITAQNVNDAFLSGMTLLATQRNNLVETRNGPAYVASEPVTTHYRYPTQRVLFSPERDANPFFHLLEALWMLGGQRDVKRMAWLVPRMAQYSDNGQWIHGAYGYRWRQWPQTWDWRNEPKTHDQIALVIEQLKLNPNSRRAVIAMWNPLEDLIYPPTGAKDLPCNTTIKFSIDDYSHNGTPKLNMVVFNRSNDIIMGCYGANAVHLSVLQEYVAAMLGVRVGWYEQISCDFHAYKEEFDRLWLLSDQMGTRFRDPYTSFVGENLIVRSLVDDPAMFDEELQWMLKRWEREDWISARKEGEIKNSFIYGVALPMLYAYHVYRDENNPRMAHSYLETVIEQFGGRIDWLVAGRDWMRRRVINRARKVEAAEQNAEYP